jgi:adenylate kinase
MEPLRKNLLITGLPGVGKTTLIRGLAQELRDLNPVGFFTTEIREGGVDPAPRTGLAGHLPVKCIRSLQEVSGSDHRDSDSLPGWL